MLSRASTDYEQPPISYSDTAPNDAIARLQRELADGTLQLAGNSKEVLRLLLHELKIPVESQILVFSKTSLQRQQIRPERPRAIYFSDNCYIGWVPGGLIEIASIDPNLGPVFYSLNPQPTEAKPSFVRDNDCLRCHAGSLVHNVPGLLARSVFTDDNGEPLLRHGSDLVDHRTPFDVRWGGWYVTGKHGKELHRGNVFAQEDSRGNLSVDFHKGANLTELSGFFDQDTYLTPTSDIVALLVFEYQIGMHNALTRASFNCRRMLEYQRALQRELNEPQTDEPTFGSVKSVFESATQNIVDHLLYRDEAGLPAGLQGSEEFQQRFLAKVPRSKDGKSLKDLRLDETLFQNRCHYLIYSELFLSLPKTLREHVYDRLAKALHPRNPDPRYSYIKAKERERIVTILRETHSDLPREWLGH